MASVSSPRGHSVFLYLSMRGSWTLTVSPMSNITHEYASACLMTYRGFYDWQWLTLSLIFTQAMETWHEAFMNMSALKISFHGCWVVVHLAAWVNVMEVSWLILTVKVTQNSHTHIKWKLQSKAVLGSEINSFYFGACHRWWRFILHKQFTVLQWLETSISCGEINTCYDKYEWWD